MRRRIWPWALLAAICGALFFWKLGAIPLIGLDEGLYSECSREMLASGDYVVPTCNGGPFYDKPPAAYWLQATSMRVFGVNSFAARLPSAVEELLLVGLTVVLGAKLFSRRAGLLAGFVLACSILTAGLARMAILDAAFALTITASLGAFLLAYCQRAPRWMYLVFWAAMGMSVMVKGPAGAVLILGVIFVFLLLRREPKALSKTMPALGALLFAAIALPWYVIVQQHTGGAFLREFLIHQNLQRALGQDFQHNMPFYYYLPVYLVGFFPWSAFVPAALTRLGRREDRASGTDDSALVFLVLWIGVMFVVFSLFRSKLPSYVYPIYPPSALLVGLLWARMMETAKLDALRRAALAAAVIALPVGAAMLIAPPRLNEPIPGLSAAVIPMGAALVVGCVAGYVMLVLKRPAGAFVALCAGMVGFMVIAVGLGLPIAARTNATPAMKMARVVARRSEPVFAFKLSPPQPQIGFYARRPVPRVDEPSGIPKDACLVVAQDGRCAELPKGGRILDAIEPYILFEFPPRK